MNVTKIAVALVAATQAVNISTSTAGLVQNDEADIADTTTVNGWWERHTFMNKSSA